MRRATKYFFTDASEAQESATENLINYFFHPDVLRFKVRSERTVKKSTETHYNPNEKETAKKDILVPIWDRVPSPAPGKATDMWDNTKKIVSLVALALKETKNELDFHYIGESEGSPPYYAPADDIVITVAPTKFRHLKTDEDVLYLLPGGVLPNYSGRTSEKCTRTSLLNNTPMNYFHAKGAHPLAIFAKNEVGKRIRMIQVEKVRFALAKSVVKDSILKTVFSFFTHEIMCQEELQYFFLHDCTLDERLATNGLYGYMSELIDFDGPGRGLNPLHLYRSSNMSDVVPKTNMVWAPPSLRALHRYYMWHYHCEDPETWEMPQDPRTPAHNQYWDLLQRIQHWAAIGEIGNFITKSKRGVEDLRTTDNAIVISPIHIVHLKLEEVACESSSICESLAQMAPYTTVHPRQPGVVPVLTLVDMVFEPMLDMPAEVYTDARIFVSFLVELARECGYLLHIPLERFDSKSQRIMREADALNLLSDEMDWKWNARFQGMGPCPEFYKGWYMPVPNFSTLNIDNTDLWNMFGEADPQFIRPNVLRDVFHWKVVRETPAVAECRDIFKQFVDNMNEPSAEPPTKKPRLEALAHCAMCGKAAPNVVDPVLEKAFCDDSCHLSFRIK